MPVLVAVPVQSSAASLPNHFPVDCSYGFGQGLLPPDCMSAIDNLPTDQPGDVHMDLPRHEMRYPEFSLIAVEDRHRLPISEEVGTCGVRVGLTALPVVDHSSWRIIRLRVMDIFHSCVEPGEPGKVGIGGTTITGDEKHLELILYSTSDDNAASSDRSLILSNQTIAAVAR